MDIMELEKKITLEMNKEAKSRSVSDFLKEHMGEGEYFYLNTREIFFSPDDSQGNGMYVFKLSGQYYYIKTDLLVPMKNGQYFHPVSDFEIDGFQLAIRKWTRQWEEKQHTINQLKLLINDPKQ